MSAVVWTSARAAVRVHRTSLVGSALVVALAAALLTATGAWLEAGLRRTGDPADLSGSVLVAVTSSFGGTAVVIAVLVVASTFAAALRPRARELALLRAVGATVGQLRRFVTAEVLLVCAVAAPLGVAVGLVLAPALAGPLRRAGVLSDGLTPTVSPWPALATVALLLPAALAAARLAARESARLDPAVAVRRAAVEPTRLPRARAVSAAVLAACGLLTAASPFAVPGTLGGATASLGAVLLVVAVALAGPVLVGEVARRGLAAAPARAGAALPRLALANARGFSRRMTGAIVPLALLLALGTVQTGTSAAVARAAQEQARDAVAADLVVQPRDGGLTPTQVAEASALPGVRSAAVTTVVPAEVRIDQDGGDVPVLGGLSWEASTVRTVPASGGYLDPGVVAGSLGALAGARTIAVSRDAALGSASLGDPVDVRIGGTQVRYRIVAVYARGLGLGDYLVADGALGSRPEGATSTLLVRTAGDAGRARHELAGAGLHVLDVPAYAEEVRDASSRQQELSTVLLLALLALVAVLAVDTLVTATVSRRAELSLLRRTGATRRQLVVLVLAESVLLTGIALAAGLACALPALVGVGQGLLWVPLPVLDGVVAWSLVGVVVTIGMTVPVLASLSVTSPRR